MPVTTEEFIQLLKNDDIEQLKHVYYSEYDWEHFINFKEVYDSIENIVNSCTLNILGYLYHAGKVVKKNKHIGKHYYKLSVKRGNMISLCDIGDIYYNEDNFKKAFEYYTRSIAIDKNYSCGQYSIGLMYYRGLGVDENYEKALKYLKLSADQGYFQAQDLLGDLYMSGKGVDKSYEKALYYYRLSAKAGYHESQKSLGMMYLKGEGIDKNYMKGYKYILLSSFNASDVYENLKDVFNDKDFQDYLLTVFKENKRLKKENYELQYRPGNPGYEGAKEEFEKLSS